jgi:GNAT superfamily N-acetyltransferase
MITIKKTTSDDLDFKCLTKLFGDYLVDIDGDEKDFFAFYNQVYIQNVLICYDNEVAIGCGAFKEYEPKVAEIKRMFVLSEQSGKGITASIFNQLEFWAATSGYTSCILETSIRLESAIALYKKMGYEIIPNYGQYIGVESSVCMKKNIN